MLVCVCVCSDRSLEGVWACRRTGQSLIINVLTGVVSPDSSFISVCVSLLLSLSIQTKLNHNRRDGTTFQFCVPVSLSQSYPVLHEFVCL